MDKKFNLIYTLLGALIVVVFLQGYFIFDLKNTFESKVQNELPTSIVAKEQTKNNFYQNSITPFEELKKMQENMQRSFNHFNSLFAYDTFFEDSFKSMGISPLSDLQDNIKEYVVEINIPGIAEENIKIDSDIKTNRVDVSAFSKKSKDVNNSKYIYKERSSQRFERSFILPSDADLKKMSSDYKNGVLKIVIPKKK